MSRITKLMLLAGVLLTVYGFVCRDADLFFFWESKYIGWVIIILGIIIFLFERVRSKKKQGRKSVLEKVGIGFLIFVLFVQAILIIIIPNTDAYKLSKEYLRSDVNLKNEIGSIRGFSLIPLGSIQKSSDQNGESGTATILLTVKGERKFKDITLHLEKRPETNWVIIDEE